jgi:hypothetical protein
VMELRWLSRCSLSMMRRCSWVLTTRDSPVRMIKAAVPYTTSKLCDVILQEGKIKIFLSTRLHVHLRTFRGGVQPWDGPCMCAMYKLMINIFMLSLHRPEDKATWCPQCTALSKILGKSFKPVSVLEFHVVCLSFTLDALCRRLIGRLSL